MTRHLDDDFLPCRLAALEKLSEELAAKSRYWERRAKAMKLSHAANVVTVMTMDLLGSADNFDWIETDDSTFGERAVRVDVVRKGQPNQGATP